MSGKTPIELINQIKLHESAKLLLSTDLPIPYIMDKIGISSRAYFDKIFKQEFGLTSSKYRKKYAVHYTYS